MDKLAKDPVEMENITVEMEEVQEKQEQSKQTYSNKVESV